MNSLFPKFWSKGEKLTQPKYLDRYFEYEQRDLFNDQLSRIIKHLTQVWPINQLLIASRLNAVTELRRETAFELQSKLLLARLLKTKKYPIISVLFLIVGNVESFAAYHIY